MGSYDGPTFYTIDILSVNVQFPLRDYSGCKDIIVE